MDEIYANCREHKFNGVNQRPRKLITYRAAMKLIMILPGVNATEIRAKFSEILQRYFAGDASLVFEIADNATSSNDLNQAARDGLPVPSEAVMSPDQLQLIATQVGQALVPILKVQLRTEFLNERKIQLSDVRMATKRKHDEMKLAHTQELDRMQAQTNQEVTLIHEKNAADKEAHERFMAQKDKEMEAQTHEIQCLKEKLALQSAPVTTTTTTTTTTGSVAPVTPCTVAGVAHAFQLLPQSLSVDRLRSIVLDAGKKATQPKYNVRVIGKRVDTPFSAYNVNEFNPEDTAIIKRIIEDQVAEEQRNFIYQQQQFKNSNARVITDMFQRA